MLTVSASKGKCFIKLQRVSQSIDLLKHKLRCHYARRGFQHCG